MRRFIFNKLLIIVLILIVLLQSLMIITEKYEKSHDSSTFQEIVTKSHIENVVKFRTLEVSGSHISMPSPNMVMTLPNMVYKSLPHLMKLKNPLKLSRYVSKGRRNITLAFGVPTVPRKHSSYLIQTLSSLIAGLSAAEEKHCLIIVFIGSQDAHYLDNVTANIKTTFPGPLESGLLEIIAPVADFYPNFQNLQPVLGGKEDAVKWRAKQNLEYAFLMMYAKDRAKYFMQLEDDVVAISGYASMIQSFVLEKSDKNWYLLEFASLGFMGKLLRSSDLKLLIEFLLTFYKEKPSDRILEDVLRIKACQWEKNDNLCNFEKKKIRLIHKFPLFNHIGKENSLESRNVFFTEQNFKYSNYQPHINPDATVITNFEEHASFTAARVYFGHSFLWAASPRKGCTLRVMFPKETKVNRVVIRSGNIEHPHDILRNADVEILTQQKYLTLQKTNITTTSTDYIKVGAFDDDGMAEINVAQPKPTREVLVRVISDSRQWVIISEFLIVVGS